MKQQIKWILLTETHTHTWVPLKDMPTLLQVLVWVCLSKFITQQYQLRSCDEGTQTNTTHTRTTWQNTNKTFSCHIIKYLDYFSFALLNYLVKYFKMLPTDTFDLLSKDKYICPTVRKITEKEKRGKTHTQVNNTVENNSNERKWNKCK